jgi:iron(III) transport system permease protein
LGTALVSTAAAVVVALSLIPLVYLLIRSSEKSASEITGLLFRTKTFEVLATTSLLVVMVILLTGFFGVLIAAGLHFLELPKKAWLIIPAVLPLAIPSYVFTYTWIAFVPAFTGFFAALFILFLTTLPYVILACLAGLTRVDASQIEVARSLGFSYPKTFFKVVLPQIRTHLSGGLLLAGLYTMSDFGAVSLLNVDTLTVTIQNMYRASYDRTAAAVISLVLITLSAIFVVADEKVRSKQQKGEVIKSTSIKSALIDKKSSKVVTVLLIAAYALFAVFIPIYVLLSRFFSNTVDISWQILLQASLSTITVALLGAGIVERLA